MDRHRRCRDRAGLAGLAAAERRDVLGAAARPALARGHAARHAALLALTCHPPDPGGTGIVTQVVQTR